MLAHIDSLIVFLGSIAIFGYGMYRTVFQGKLPHIRRLPALEAVDEGIGIALETGKKVHVGLPGIDLVGLTAAQSLVSFSILGYVARKAAEAGVPAVYTTGVPAAYPIMDGVIHDAYAEAGKLDMYENPEMVQIRVAASGGAGDDVYPYFYANFLARENVGFSLVTGLVGKPMLFIGETNQAEGIFSILAYPIVDKIEWGVPTFDYTMFMLETYTAGAWITKDKIQLGSVVGTDIWVWIFIAAVVVGTIIASILGSPLPIGG